MTKDPRFEKLTCDHKGTYADDCIVNRVKQHQDLQGKKEKRRMKKHLKKSQRQRKTGNLPWYKRIWIRRR